MMKRRLITVLAVAAMMLGAMVVPAMAGPTCSDVLPIENHGQHIIGDYVLGVGHDSLDWPPAGQVGDTGVNNGVAVSGGPGPGHFTVDGLAPGASFCTNRAEFTTPGPFTD